MSDANTTTTPNTPAGGAVAWTLRFPAPDPTPELRAATGDDGYGRINPETTFGTEQKANEYADSCGARYVPEEGRVRRVRAPELRPLVVPLYTQPPATVSADAVLALVGKWRQQADKLELGALEADSIGLKKSADLSDAHSILLRENADELEALTRGGK